MIENLKFESYTFSIIITKNVSKISDVHLFVLLNNAHLMFKSITSNLASVSFLELLFTFSNLGYIRTHHYADFRLYLFLRDAFIMDLNSSIMCLGLHFIRLLRRSLASSRPLRSRHSGRRSSKWTSWPSKSCL